MLPYRTLSISTRPLSDTCLAPFLEKSFAFILSSRARPMLSINKELCLGPRSYALKGIDLAPTLEQDLAAQTALALETMHDHGLFSTCDPSFLA